MPSLNSLPAPPTLGNPITIISNNRWSQLPSSPAHQMELITRAAKQNLTTVATAPAVAMVPVGIGGIGSVGKSTNLHQQLPRVLVPRIESSVSVGVGVGGGGGGTTLGDLLGQEQLAGTSQTLCHYRRNSSSGILPSVESANNGQQQSAQPISLVCQLGCCPTVPGGCCTLDESGGAGTGNSATNNNNGIGTLSSTYHWALALLCAFILCVLVSKLAMLALYWANRRQDRRRRRFRLAEKYSLGIGGGSSQTASSSYEGGQRGPPSLTSASSGSGGGGGGIVHHHHHPQQISTPIPFCAHPTALSAVIAGAGVNATQFRRQFYSANSPTTTTASPPASASALAALSSPVDRRHHPNYPQQNFGGISAAAAHFGPQHLLRPYHYGIHHPHQIMNANMNNANNGNSPPAAAGASSAYHAPDEMFFRSSF